MWPFLVSIVATPPHECLIETPTPSDSLTKKPRVSAEENDRMFLYIYNADNYNDNNRIQ